MTARTLTLLCVFLSFLRPHPSPACCAVGRDGQPVVNADQTVLLVWDPATKTEHFIRKASFKAGGGDFGFLVPTPTRPQLSESGNTAFPALADITRPQYRGSSGFSCGCAAPTRSLAAAPVTVVERKEVAGFDAAVLSASSATALTGWLRQNGFAFSPEVEAWAAPYIHDGWMITALRLARPKAATASEAVNATALRISFHTERPLFPYREPDSRQAARTLGVSSRLLRLYFISDARYEGKLAGTDGWSGQPKWSHSLSAAQKTNLLDLLKLPATTGPATWWLTEFEDRWPYGVAPGDLYFSRARDQAPISRDAGAGVFPMSDISFALIVLLAVAVLFRRNRRRVGPEAQLLPVPPHPAT
jgi:hypothetical protein